MTPRFEFRAFAEGFGIAAARLRQSGSCDKITESREVYFVAADAYDHNVKVRNGSLDVKQLIEQRDRLERWKPVLQADFPLSRSFVLEQLGPLLDIRTSNANRSAYTLPQFVSEFVRPSAPLSVGYLFKRRFHFAWGTCHAELDELLINGAAIESFAVESESEDAVLQALDDLGLSGYENINYPRVLRRIFGMEPWPEGTWWL